MRRGLALAYSVTETFRTILTRSLPTSSRAADQPHRPLSRSRRRPNPFQGRTARPTPFLVSFLARRQFSSSPFCLSLSHEFWPPNLERRRVERLVFKACRQESPSVTRRWWAITWHHANIRQGVPLVSGHSGMTARMCSIVRLSYSIRFSKTSGSFRPTDANIAPRSWLAAVFICSDNWGSSRSPTPLGRL